MWRRKALGAALALALIALISGNPAIAATKRAGNKRTVASAAKVDDATVTKNVEARLAKTRSLKDVSIHVQTAGGVVTLAGTVPKWWQKGLATRETKMVAGVKKVDNQIKIAPGGMPKRKKHAKTPAA